MRSAAEILFPIHQHPVREAGDLEMFISFDDAVKAINEARSVAIEECKISINENAITGYLWAGDQKELLTRLNQLLDKKINELK